MTPDQRRIQQQAADSAITRLWASLQPLRSINTFLQTGAHPDDETSSLLARLSIGDGVRVAYACAVRGEGGQNAIGTEARNMLGALRTREMEEAARTLGMQLFWLNEDYDGEIFDFGFSKTSEETFAHWGYDRTLERLVRVIRTFRPDVMAPTFLDVPGQHGHHRAVTVATAAAFTAAAEPEAFPEHRDDGLEPWQVKKLYLPAWSGGGGSYDDEVPPPNATISVPVGHYHPVYGATYDQIAQWSRAHHRSQGMGRWVAEGEQSVPLHRKECVILASASEQDLFDGLPRSLGELGNTLPEGPLREAILAAQGHIDEALHAFPDNRQVAQAVHQALAAVREAAALVPESALQPATVSDIAYRLSCKTIQLSHASACASLLVLRLAASPVEVTPGGSTEVTLTAYRGGPTPLEDVTLALTTPPGWTCVPLASPSGSDPEVGDTLTAHYRLEAPDSPVDAVPYRFSFHPLLANTGLYGMVGYVADGVPVTITVEPEQHVTVLPPLSLDPQPAGLVLNRAASARQPAVDIKITSLVDTTVAAEVSLSAPEGWRTEPPSAPVTLPGRGRVATARITLIPPPDLAPGRHVLSAKADGDVVSTDTIQTVAHEHVGRTHLVRPATATVLAMTAELPNIRIGYVDGGSDHVHLWLRQLGSAVDLLDDGALATADLAVFDTIVVGIMAFGCRPDLLTAAPRLRDYVEAGGTLVTQYHRPWDNWDPETVPPRLLEIGQPSLRWRVTDANAAVAYLQPDHPLLNHPNTISPEDWSGWVKERGLYFAKSWAPEYSPLLAMADPGEEPLEGALLSADIGRGRHVYTGLVLHTQMENLVPGAFRLFANLVTPRAT